MIITNINSQQLPRTSLFGRWGVIGIVITVVALIVGIFSIGALVENLDAHEIMVIQSPIAGQLDVYTDPGIKWQGFGKVTKYPRRTQYSFSEGDNDDTDTAKRLRFNDGGHATLSGAVSWEMPLDVQNVIEIHKKFGSALGVEQQAVARMIDAAVYLAGPLMSSVESAGERRADLVQYINDQAANGVYVTRPKNVMVKDSLSGVEKSAIVTEIERDKNGQPLRQQGSMLKEFNIHLLPLSINELKYDGTVEDQIKQRQVATNQVQIAIAMASKAEQDALTIAKQGEATAAKAKWDQETIKATKVTEAQQKLEVATLAAREAEQYKRTQILIGEGDGQRKRLVMEADGALDPKLEAYKQVSAQYADAIKNAQPGAWSPVVQMGQSLGGTGGSAQTLIDLFTAKTARDLGLDMSVQGKGNTAKK